MRLIDADDLREFPDLPESGTEDMIINYIYECGLGDLELYVTEECPIDVEQALKDLCRKVIGSFKNIIDTQPTAYDVEKVVEQLMTVHVEGYCPSESLECVLDKTCSDCYREKITEIIRSGGI